MSDFPDLSNVVGDPVALQVTVPSNPCGRAGDRDRHPRFGPGWRRHPVGLERLQPAQRGAGRTWRRDAAGPRDPRPASTTCTWSFRASGRSTVRRRTSRSPSAIPTTTMLVSNRTSATVGELPVVLTAAVSGVTPHRERHVPRRRRWRRRAARAGGARLVHLEGELFVEQPPGRRPHHQGALRRGPRDPVLDQRPGHRDGGGGHGRACIVLDVDGQVLSVERRLQGQGGAGRHARREGHGHHPRVQRVRRAQADVEARLEVGRQVLGRLGRQVAVPREPPAGRYTVKASFKDTTGHSRTITTHATISWRKAVWKSGTLVTHYGDQLAYYAKR